MAFQGFINGVTETQQNILAPETFRLPARGHDPHFGLTRSWYYAAEADGRIQLIRLRSKGKNRGVTLVRYSQVQALIQEASAERNLFPRQNAVGRNKPGVFAHN